MVLPLPLFSYLFMSKLLMSTKFPSIYSFHIFSFLSCPPTPSLYARGRIASLFIAFFDFLQGRISVADIIGFSSSEVISSKHDGETSHFEGKAAPLDLHQVEKDMNIILVFELVFYIIFPNKYFNGLDLPYQL